MGRFSNKIERSEVREGDHIYTYRNSGAYSHHGIYVGDGKVVHYTAVSKEYSGFISANTHSERSCPKCVHKPNNGVVLICLDCFLRDGSLRRYKYGVTPFVHKSKRGGTCTIAPSDPPERVVHRANYLLQNGFGHYNIFRNNCEDFCLYCKTELWLVDCDKVGRSAQVSTALSALLMTLSASVCATLGLASVLSLMLVLMDGGSISIVVGVAKLNVAGASVAGGVGSVKHFFKRKYAKDMGVRMDVFKVAVEDLRVILRYGEMDEENKKKFTDLKEKTMVLKNDMA